MRGRTTESILVLAIIVFAFMTADAHACRGRRFADRPSQPIFLPQSGTFAAPRDRGGFEFSTERRGLLPWRTDRTTLRSSWDRPGTFSAPRGYCPGCGR